jgi:hypothetical protein
VRRGFFRSADVGAAAPFVKARVGSLSDPEALRAGGTSGPWIQARSAVGWMVVAGLRKSDGSASHPYLGGTKGAAAPGRRGDSAATERRPPRQQKTGADRSDAGFW